MQFQVLGPLEVATADRKVTPRSTKIRSLIAVLCVKTGVVLSTADLFDALWSGDPPRTATTALQVYVSKLRKHLDTYGGPTHRLITRPHGYVLELETHELDLLEFDHLSRSAEAAMSAGHPDRALRSLQRACSLWRGPALADLRGRPTFDSLARQLDEKRIDVLERRIAIQLRLSQHGAIIGELYGLTHEHPTWESVHAHLMISLYRSGRVAEALDVYRKIRHSLVSELGLEPGEEIQRLHKAILRRDRSLDAS
jgi:DNA-binding SARP family transcriptional activator